MNEQKKYRDMPEVNSDLYKEMMDRGVIKIIEDNDGTSYFGYAVIDPSMAPILNLDGFVKMENKIYKICCSISSWIICRVAIHWIWITSFFFDSVKIMLTFLIFVL